MIHASIAGGESDCAGELIRILLYHPDVEIISVYAPALAGKAIDDIHHGMIGDTDLRFNSSIDFDKSNVIFICAPQPEQFYAELPEDMRVVDMVNTHISTPQDNYVYAICELNRKPLVRGALRTAVPTPVAQVVLLALLPLAKNLLINGDVEIKSSTSVAADAITEIETVIKTLQFSFNHNIIVSPVQFQSEHRAMTVQVSFDCGIDAAQAQQIFDDFYDDHNFTFTVAREPQVSDVANTNKCIVNINKQDDKLVICAAIDPLIKGAAGTAVHAMNLLFGLHERVGLTLKPSLS
jgi:N-acetyl-gamma-glutamyl-phosphate reductase